MNLSKKFEELILKQLESFGCSMGVTNLVMYLALAKEGTKASFEMIGQWPQIDRLLVSRDTGQFPPFKSVSTLRTPSKMSFS